MAALQTLVEDRLALVHTPHLHRVELEDAVAAIGAFLFHRGARRLSFYRLFGATRGPGRGCPCFCARFQRVGGARLPQRTRGPAVRTLQRVPGWYFQKAPAVAAEQIAADGVDHETLVGHPARVRRLRGFGV